MVLLEKKSTLEKILATLLIHLNPEYLGEGWAKRIDNSGTDKKKLQEYWELLLSVEQFYKKIQRYETYFSEFYPTTGNIQKYEALDHHVAAYLEDLTTFKNKVKTFLGTLKNDLKRIASNSTEIEEALVGFIGKVDNVFKNVSEQRDPLRHRGLKFTDKDLIDAETFHMLTSEDNPLRKSFKPEFISELEIREKVSFEKSKENWIILAKKNAEQMSGFTEEVFKRNEGFIYQLLKVKPIQDIMGQEI